MSRIRTTTMVLGALLLTCPTAALAKSSGRAGHGGQSEVQRRLEVTDALAVAEAYWGTTPCSGAIVVAAAQSVPAGMAPDTDAWVTFESSLGADDLSAPAATYTACRIGLARWQWPTPATIEGDWNMFCLTVTHEVGHLLGHPHSTVPGSVMAPVFINESSVPQICRRRNPFRRSSPRA